MHHPSCPSQWPESCRELFTNSGDAAIGKNGHDIAATHFWRDGLHDCIGIREKACPAAVSLDLSGERVQLQALVFWDRFRAKHAGNVIFVGLLQASHHITLPTPDPQTV